MKMNVVAYYRKHDNFSRYLTTNKARVKEFSQLYASNKPYFGHRVLDLACGGGVLGFILEQHGHVYTGVDINPDMISSARRHAEEVRSRNRFIKADITRLMIEGKYVTICMLGNALCHFSTHDLAKIIQRINSHCEKGAYFIVDYRDIILQMYNKQWNAGRTLIMKDRGRLSVTKGCDTRTGFVQALTSDLHGEDKVGLAHALWSPFIISVIMNERGWSLTRRRFWKKRSAWLDVYRRIRFPRTMNRP